MSVENSSKRMRAAIAVGTRERDRRRRGEIAGQARPPVGRDRPEILAREELAVERQLRLAEAVPLDLVLVLPAGLPDERAVAKEREAVVALVRLPDPLRAEGRSRHGRRRGGGRRCGEHRRERERQSHRRLRAAQGEGELFPGVDLPVLERRSRRGEGAADRGPRGDAPRHEVCPRHRERRPVPRGEGGEERPRVAGSEQDRGGDDLVRAEATDESALARSGAGRQSRAEAPACLRPPQERRAMPAGGRESIGDPEEPARRGRRHPGEKVAEPARLGSGRRRARGPLDASAGARRDPRERRRDRPVEPLGSPRSRGARARALSSESGSARAEAGLPRRRRTPRRAPIARAICRRASGAIVNPSRFLAHGAGPASDRPRARPGERSGCGAARGRGARRRGRAARRGAREEAPGHGWEARRARSSSIEAPAPTSGRAPGRA